MRLTCEPILNPLRPAVLFNTLWSADAEEEDGMPEKWRLSSGAEKQATREPRL